MCFTKERGRTFESRLCAHAEAHQLAHHWGGGVTSIRMDVGEEHPPDISRSCELMWKSQVIKRKEHSVKYNLFYSVF